MADERSQLAFLGTYTEADADGIFTYRVDAETGELERVAETPGGANPSFLAFDPDGEYLYAVNSVEDGAVTAFSVDRGSGELTRLNSQSSGGDGPCHVSVDATGSYALVANYGGGSVSMLPIEGDGRLAEATDVVRHEGSSVDPDRQTEPHPHSIVPGPTNRFAYAPDLGTDEVVVYEMDLDGGRLRRRDAATVHDGAGPRHFDFHPDADVGYLIDELDSTLVAFEHDAETGALSELATVDTLPDGFDGENYPADVHVHPSGRWVYGSNRGHDSIAVFDLDDPSRPRLVGTESTRGEWPRNFAIDPAGEFLFAENQHTDDVVTFRIDDDTGELDATGQVIDAPAPVCMKFLRTAR